jgi:predicted permease
VRSPPNEENTPIDNSPSLLFLLFSSAGSEGSEGSEEKSSLLIPVVSLFAVICVIFILGMIRTFYLKPKARKLKNQHAQINVFLEYS